VSRNQKSKTNLDFTEARETASGSGISCTVCKAESHSRQITMPASHHSVFLSFLTGRMPFLSPNQSTEGKQQQHTPVQKAPIVAALERKSQGRGQSTKRFIEENYHKTVHYLYSI